MRTKSCDETRPGKRQRVPRPDRPVTILAVALVFIVTMALASGVPTCSAGEAASLVPHGSVLASLSPEPGLGPVPPEPGLGPVPPEPKQTTEQNGLGATEAEPTPIPAVDWPELPELADREPDYESESFQVYSADPEWELGRDFAVRWGRELPTILAAVSAKTGRELPVSPVMVAFAPRYEARCPARGLASMGSEPMILVYADESTPDSQIRGVLAHEMVHQLTIDGAFARDGVLTEGIANWGADDMMLEWQGFPSWDAAVLDYLARGEYVPISDEEGLSPEPGEDCLARRDRVYNERAAFVGWLVEKIELETVLAMPYFEVAQRDIESGEVLRDPETGEVFTYRLPDYRTATGYDLETLELLWLMQLWANQ